MLPTLAIQRDLETVTDNGLELFFATLILFHLFFLCFALFSAPFPRLRLFG
jgi:hypothetical protein